MLILICKVDVALPFGRLRRLGSRRHHDQLRLDLMAINNDLVQLHGNQSSPLPCYLTVTLLHLHVLIAAFKR